ncbi:rhamnogalacturonan lyase family protein [Novipirellula artificiosorum]|uniref:Rhamnogalacturonan endolyase YesW n=1 Tax=Novipirellula artificiosorum TaxID=2528016 RepID=A0A5C6DKE6_9BACT|nr:silent information regulator protein Sir2 [Novipirellula artificiosorum]TWU36101.1 Rhamnogalacturonan endolyase YesW precursor [Novipirellula artificiosorum]
MFFPSAFGKLLRIGSLTRCMLGVSLMVFVNATASSQSSLRFEAETITEPSSAWKVNRHTDDHWNLWSTDQGANEKWSGGIVLQSPVVKADRSTPQAGAPPLHSVVRDIPPGKYYVDIGGVGRPIAISRDGVHWISSDVQTPHLGLVEIGEEGFELWLDDRYASKTNPGSCYYDFLEFTPLPDPQRKPKVDGWASDRVTEKLSRGLTVMTRQDGSVYVGWRLLKSDPESIAFHVYRQTEKEKPIRLNPLPITQTTDFVDLDPVADQSSQYFVASLVQGKEIERSVAVDHGANASARNHFTIKLQGDYSFQKCGIADLNGDGNYDFVIKQPGGNVDPYEKYWKPSPSTFKVEAYLADGTFLWRYDLGWSIEQGIWYSPMIVHDLDGDGKAEVCLKAGEGDPRDNDGRVQSGPEYLLVLDGMTGKPKTRVDWISREEIPTYNRSSRNQMCVAYLDGKTPCLIMERGTYKEMQVKAFEMIGGTLRELWSWSDAEEGRRYQGQGAHSMHAIDVDGDSRDEVFLGSSVLDDNGVGLWSTGLGHPDHHYVGDIDPDRPGLEVYYGMETRQSLNGCCMVDAATGQWIWGIDFPTRHVHSTGMCSDLDPAIPGWECYSSDTDADKKSNARWLFDARGNRLRSDLDWGFGRQAVYWDADPQRELIGKRSVDKYTGQGYPTEIAGSPVAFADLLGDWREEFITSVGGELRVYTTTIPASDRRACLMQDPIYRADVAIQAMGYTQTPMLSEGSGL